MSPIKRNLIRNIWVGALSILFLSLLFIVTTIMYYFSFGYNILNDEEHISINDTIRLVNDCTYISDYQLGNITFAPFALVLILLFSWSVKRERWCRHTCDGRPGKWMDESVFNEMIELFRNHSTYWTISNGKSFYQCNSFWDSRIWSIENLRRITIQHGSTDGTWCTYWIIKKDRVGCSNRVKNSHRMKRKIHWLI